MTETLAYYDSGKEIFKPGEQVYINRCFEQAESHLHMHDYLEIAYVYSGKGIHRIGGREFTVSRGDLFVINYDVPHEFRSVSSMGEGKIEIFNCVFRPEFIDRSLISSRCFSDITHIFLFNSLFQGETMSNDIRLIGKDSAEIEELYEKMYEEYTAGNYGHLEILRAYLVELLIKIFRLYRRNEPEEYHKREIFDKVIRFMKSHYSREIKLEELAAMTFLSRNYFCTCFKECTGTTVLEYIQKLRIDHACALLRETDKKVVDIACEVGYRDLKFFYKTFRKITGKSPGECRKSRDGSPKPIGE